MSGGDHERWSEDVAAYMLGVLGPEEATAFERHAEGCEHCRSEMRWLTAAVEVLPEAVERHEPPPQLRQRLLSEVEADARAEAAAPPAAEGVLARLSARLRRLGSGSHGWRPAAGLAALALVVVVALGGYEIGSGGNGGGNPTAFVSGSAEVVREGDAGELHLTAVKQLPPDRVLEAWVRRDGQIEPVKALFVPDSSGEASTRIGDMTDVDLVMVTTEPEGGSASPTSAPIAEVPVS